MPFDVQNQSSWIGLSANRRTRISLPVRCGDSALAHDCPQVTSALENDEEPTHASKTCRKTVQKHRDKRSRDYERPMAHSPPDSHSSTNNFPAIHNYNQTKSAENEPLGDSGSSSDTNSYTRKILASQCRLKQHMRPKDSHRNDRKPSSASVDYTAALHHDLNSHPTCNSRSAVMVSARIFPSGGVRTRQSAKVPRVTPKYPFNGRKK